MEEKRNGSVFWGIIIIMIGIVLLGNHLWSWNFDIFFDGWWTLFIIVPSIYGIFKKEFTSSIIGLIIGTLLLLSSQHILSWQDAGKIFLPIMLIIIGLSFIFKSKVTYHRLNKNGVPEYIGIFSGNETRITDKFVGASCIAVFGGVDLDLRDAIIKDDIVIDCVTVFGGIDIRVPDNVIVKTSGVPIFGGIENKSRQEKGPTILINYVSIFAGIDVK